MRTQSQARKKLFEKGDRTLHQARDPYLESRASPKKADEHFFSLLKNLGQFSRHWVGVYSYITNLYTKQESNNKKG